MVWRWLVASLALFLAAHVAAWLAPGQVVLGGVVPTLIAAALLSLVNVTVRPLLVILTMPLTLVTLGLFLLVINAVMVLLVAGLVPGFSVAGFGTALGLSVLISVASWVLNWFFPVRRRRR